VVADPDAAGARPARPGRWGLAARRLLPVAVLRRADRWRSPGSRPPRSRRPSAAPPPAATVEEFSAAQVLDEHLGLVLGALSAAAVPHAVTSARPMRRRVVLVLDADRAAALAALATAEPLRGAGALVGPPGETGATVPVPDLGSSSAASRAAAVTVFVDRVAAGRGGRRLLGSWELGCDVEFWPVTDRELPRADGGRLPAGTALAPRPGSRAPYLTPAQRRPAPGGPDDRWPTYPGLLDPHVFDVHFPVDAVYTWVDDSDPEWQAAFAAARSRAGDPPASPLAANAARYHSLDELRYSLRSLHMYAGWFRTVHLVTNGQLPEWLNRDDPRLHLVRHEEIFESPDQLPTFNSHAIEARLHHVPGLAEHFVYLNDDVLFGRPVPPDQLFLPNGTPYFFPTPGAFDLGPQDPADLPVVAAAKSNRAVIWRRFGVRTSAKMQHVGHPQRRSTLQALEAELADEVRRTSASPFRGPADLSVASSLSAYYGFLTGRAVPSRLSYAYVDLAARDAALRLDRLERRRDVDMFCLNQVGSPPDAAARARLEQFLERMFPLPSPFEIPPSRRPAH
jgi:hypothetical protein